MAKQTYNQKLNNSKNVLEIKDVSLDMALKNGGPKMLIAPPLEYDALMKQVPTGKVITIDRMRIFLAIKHNANWTCPLTAGIFINIVANASVERNGVDETPYWRTLKKDGELCEKFPGGIDIHKKMLEMEGHTVIKKRNRYFVDNYEDQLYEII